MRTWASWTDVTAVVLSLGLFTTAAQAGTASTERYYANQTPYGNPARTAVAAPPPGYELIFVQTVARHGARSLTNNKGEKRAMAVWKAASKKGALTSRGKRFDNDLRAFQKAEKRIGYGKLSRVGKAEWRGIGRRTAANYRSYLTAAAAKNEKIAMVSSPIYRTKQSASAMRSSIHSSIPDLKFAKRTVDQDFLIESAASRKGNAAIAAVERRSSVRAAARRILLRLYKPSYVKRLKDPVDKATDIYRLYNTAPGVRDDTSVTFSRYVPRRDAKVMAELVDARNFYRYGPGVAGERKSFRQADPILDDFFARLDKRIAGGSTAAVFRHAHGEVTMPFAARIKAPGSAKGAKHGAAFSYKRNPWRGKVAGLLAGSIEWAAYRDARGQVLVTMRQNERPVAFDSRCTPSAAGAQFYSLGELKKCLR